ncbi:MAG: hypothetical protein ACI841_003216 [Planctomycetota bacterium]|jgi:hypothetical protein
MLLTSPLLLSTALLSTSSAFSPTPIPTQDDSATDLIVMYSAGGEACFADPKDQALLKALQLIGERLPELSAEIPDFPPLPPDAIPLLGRLLSGPMTFRLGTVGPDPSMMVPYYGQLTLPEASAEEASALSSRMTNLLTMAGMPAEADADGKVTLPLPIPAWYGPEGNSFVLAVGMDDGGRVEPGYTGLPDGVQPTLAASIEYGKLMKSILQLAEMYGEGAEMQEALQVYESLGLYDLSLQMAAGHDEDRSYSILRMPGYAASMREQGLMPERALSSKDLALIPVDANFASVSTANIGGTLDMMMGFIEQAMADAGMGGDPLEMAAGMTGIHPRTDLIDHLGSSFGLYTSDSTGGGGLMSAVMFMEVKNGESLTDTSERLIGMINGIAGQQAMGYVAFRDWESSGIDYTTLTFPGLPVPLELTCTMSDGYAFMGLTPQAVMAAVHQQKSGGKSLLDHPRFREQLAGGIEGLMSVQFIDTPRLLADGYGVMSLVASALRNGTRSRTDESRDAGLILPAYPLLVKGARATVTATRADGDDWVAETRGDRSVLVNLTSGFGAVTGTPLGLLLLGGLGAGIFQQQEVSAGMIESEVFGR